MDNPNTNNASEHRHECQSQGEETTRRAHFTPVNRPKSPGKHDDDECNDKHDDNECNELDTNHDDDGVFEIDETIYTWSPKGGYRSGIFSHELPEKVQTYHRRLTSAQKARFTYRRSKPVVPPQVKRANSLLKSFLQDILDADGAADPKDEDGDDHREPSSPSKVPSTPKRRAKMLPGPPTPKSRPRARILSTTTPKASRSPKVTMPAMFSGATSSPSKRKAQDAGSNASPLKSSKIADNPFSNAGSMSKPPPQFNLSSNISSSAASGSAHTGSLLKRPSQFNLSSNISSSAALGSAHTGSLSKPPPQFNPSTAPSATSFEGSNLNDDGQWRFMDTSLGDSQTVHDNWRFSEPQASAYTGFGETDNGLHGLSPGDDPFVDQQMASPGTATIKEEPSNDEDDPTWFEEDDNDEYQDDEAKSDDGDDSDFRSSASKRRSNKPLKVRKGQVKVAIPRSVTRRQRSPRPTLAKWNDRDWRMIVIGIVTECGYDDLKINFTRVARWVGPNVTGSALQQAILKLRDRMIREGEFDKDNMPPIKMAWTKNKKEDALVKEGKLVLPLHPIEILPKVPMVDAGVQVMMIRLPAYYREDPPYRKYDQIAAPEFDNSNQHLWRPTQVTGHGSNSASGDQVHHSTTGLWQPGNPPLLLTQPFAPSEASVEQSANVSHPQSIDNPSVPSQGLGYGQNAFAGQMPNSYADDTSANSYDHQSTTFNNAGYTQFNGANNEAFDNSQCGASTLSDPNANAMNYDNTQYGGSAFPSQYGDQNNYLDQNMEMPNVNFQGNMTYSSGALDQNAGVEYPDQTAELGDIDFQGGTGHDSGVPQHSTGLSYSDQNLGMGNLNLYGGMPYVAGALDQNTSSSYTGQTTGLGSINFQGSMGSDTLVPNTSNGQFPNTPFRNDTTGTGSTSNEPLANTGDAGQPRLLAAPGSILVNGVIMEPFIWPPTDEDDAPHGPSAGLESLDGANDEPRGSSTSQSDTARSEAEEVELDADEANIIRFGPDQLEAMRSAEIRLVRQGLLTEAWWTIFPGPEPVWGGTAAKTPPQGASGNARQRQISEINPNARRNTVADFYARRGNGSRKAIPDQENRDVSSYNDYNRDADENGPECIKAAFNMVGEYAKRFERDPRC